MTIIQLKSAINRYLGAKITQMGITSKLIKLATSSLDFRIPEPEIRIFLYGHDLQNSIVKKLQRLEAQIVHSWCGASCSIEAPLTTKLPK